MSRDQAETIPKPLRVLLETGSMAGMSDAELIERFTTRRDAGAEAAFAAIVSRHGPMVLGTCRLMLEDPHTAEDAFQAVFLVLARRAGSIRNPELLGPWLHGVASKIARKARVQIDRRRRREKPEVEMASVESIGCEADVRSVRDEEAAVVHEEIGRLPERYRRAVVLCHFEGLTHAEAARRLGCAPGTVSSLVSRARELLRTRLGRRGLTGGSLALIASFEPKMAAAAVPPLLERATIQAALCYATKRAVAFGIVSPSAALLAGDALKSMTLYKLAIAGLVAMTLGIAVAAGGFAAGMPRAVEPPHSRKPRQAITLGNAPDKEPVTEPAWRRRRTAAVARSSGAHRHRCLFCGTAARRKRGAPVSRSPFRVWAGSGRVLPRWRRS